MTEREKAIVSLYTGVYMLDTNILCKYASEYLGLKVKPYELKDNYCLKEAIMIDFSRICDDSEELGVWESKAVKNGRTKYTCSKCHCFEVYLSSKSMPVSYKYCPHCGAPMAIPKISYEDYSF